MPRCLAIRGDEICYGTEGHGAEHTWMLLPGALPETPARPNWTRHTCWACGGPNDQCCRHCLEKAMAIWPQWQAYQAVPHPETNDPMAAFLSEIEQPALRPLLERDVCR